MNEPEKACQGGRVLEEFDFAECVACGKQVRWDLRDHEFWGFAASCPEAQSRETAEAREPGGGR